MDVSGNFTLTNSNNISSLRQANQLSKKQDNLLKQLSSAERLTSASVDPAGMGVARKMEAQLAQYDQEIMNLQDEYSRYQVQDGAYSGIGESLMRIETLQLQAKNDTLTDDDREAIQMEIDQLVEGVGGIIEDTQYNEKPAIEAGEELSALLEEGVSATGDMSQVQDSLTEINSSRAEVGASMNSTLQAINRENIAYENTVASYSRINDMDMARGIMDLNNTQVSQEANMAMMSNMFNFNKTVMLKLLG